MADMSECSAKKSALNSANRITASKKFLIVYLGLLGDLNTFLQVEFYY